MKNSLIVFSIVLSFLLFTTLSYAQSTDYFNPPRQLPEKIQNQPATYHDGDSPLFLNSMNRTYAKKSPIESQKTSISQSMYPSGYTSTMLNLGNLSYKAKKQIFIENRNASTEKSAFAGKNGHRSTEIIVDRKADLVLQALKKNQ